MKNLKVPLTNRQTKKQVKQALVYLTLLTCALLSAIPGYGQEYVIFRKKKGFNSTTLSENISLYQNHVTTAKSPDTLIDLYNYYYNHPEKYRLYELNFFEKQAPNTKLTSIPADLIVTAVVQHLPGTRIPLKKLTKAQVDTMKILSKQEMLETFYGKAKQQVDSRRYGMPINRTLKYKLIINEGNNYFLIDQPIPIVTYFVAENPWYFPTDFKAAVLNVNDRSDKHYTYGHLELMANDTRFRIPLWYRLFDRVYPAKKGVLPGFKFTSYTFWELLNGDAEMMYGNKIFPNYHPGLGTFTLLPKVGIIDCSLKSSIRNHNIPEDLSRHIVESINDLNPEDFEKLLKEHIYTKIWTDE